MSAPLQQKGVPNKQNRLPRTAHGVVEGGETVQRRKCAPGEGTLMICLSRRVNKKKKEMVEFFIRGCNERLSVDVGKIGELTKRDRLKVACKKRLSMIRSVETSWSDALAILALPYNIPCKECRGVCFVLFLAALACLTLQVQWLSNCWRKLVIRFYMCVGMNQLTLDGIQRYLCCVVLCACVGC